MVGEKEGKQKPSQGRSRAIGKKEAVDGPFWKTRS